MNPVEERIAEAGQMLKMYGSDTPRIIAPRIGALAATGDAAGVQRWQEIAAQVTILAVLRSVQ